MLGIVRAPDRPAIVRPRADGPLPADCPVRVDLPRLLGTELDRAIALACRDATASTGDADRATADPHALRVYQESFWARVLASDGAPGRTGEPEPDAGLPAEATIAGCGAALAGLVRSVMTVPGQGWRRARPGREADRVVALIGAVFSELAAHASAKALAAEEERNAARREALSGEFEQQAALAVVGDGLRRLAGGDLTVRLPDLTGRYGELGADFNAAVGELQTMLRAIAGGVKGMGGGVDVISESATDLSGRTEEQAVSIRATVGTVGEITSRVRATADSAEHARSCVAEAKAGAEEAGSVVQDAVAAMTAIERSSSEIALISGMIDEIAFQTNLLALNAGIEAARAGQAGKGFAVVAFEVRALAQRSADNARSIRELIDASRSQIETGVRLVARTGVALGRIVDQVTEVNGVITGIAASAQEQATGLSQVNTAIARTDGVTRQNAAMAQDSSAIVRCLQAEAGELAQLLGQLKLGENRPGGAAKRKDERHERGETVMVVANGRRAAYRLTDCSTGGARFDGEAPAPLDARVDVELPATTLPARIVRIDRSSFAVQFEGVMARGIVSRYLLLTRANSAA